MYRLVFLKTIASSSSKGKFVPESKTIEYGYRCPVQGCKQKKNRAFKSAMGVAKHILDQHGEEELAKRLRIKKS